ncbi:MAG: glycoside hydrolase [Clostridium sp.]|nr:MAG: glycoside hydrolase [Clostridium sp.]
MKKVCVIGHFAYGKNYLDGQTVKTKIVTKELKQQLGKDEIMTIDTHGGSKKLLKLLFQLPHVMKKVENIIIMPAHNGIRFFAPLLAFFNNFFHIKLHYVVIGGWLPEFLESRKELQNSLKKFNGIYVETNTMKNNLEKLGFKNVYILPNCKELNILKEDELIYATSKPFKLCTFSRVMKEKGIEDAVNAVEKINKQYGETIFTLDIYGQVDSSQVEWFENLKEKFSNDIKYKGLVPFDQSTNVLKEYYALLFPTHFYTEGIPGTIIDAYASGVPVISAKWESFEDLVNDKVGYGYSFGNNSELVKILQNAVIDSKKIGMMKKNCIKEAKKYTPQVALIRLIASLYND